MNTTIETRNADFLAAVEEAIKEIQLKEKSSRAKEPRADEKPRNLTDDAIEEALKHPKRFYVSREHAIDTLRQVSRRGCSDTDRRDCKRAMWEELKEALEIRRELKPKEDEVLAVEWVLENVVPSHFFISESYAKKLYYKLRRAAASKHEKPNICLLTCKSTHTMNFHLHSSAIINQVLALSALRALTEENEPGQRYVLSRDNLPALRSFIRMSFTTIYMRLEDIATDYDVSFPDDEENPLAEGYTNDQITLSLSLPIPDRCDKGFPKALRLKLEQAVTLNTLALAYSSPYTTESASYREEAEQIIEDIRESLGYPSVFPGISPCFF